MSAAYPATRRQQDLLRFIAGYQRAHGGKSPTFEQMAQGLGSSAKSTAFHLLRKCEERGHVRRDCFGRIEVLSPVPVPHAPDGAPLYAVALPELAR